MTDVGSIIKIQGALVTIIKRTTGAEDSYGDPAVTWTPEDEQERVLIQPRERVNVGIVRTLAGEIDETAFRGYLLPYTVIVKGDILEADGSRYMVGIIHSASVFGVLSHYEADLALLQEGT